jgi:hypothetical protein
MDVERYVAAGREVPAPRRACPDGDSRIVEDEIRLVVDQAVAELEGGGGVLVALVGHQGMRV